MRTFKLPGKRSIADAMQFAPDGQRLAIQALGCVVALDTTTGAVQPVYKGCKSKRGTAGVGITSDGRSVVYFHEGKKDVRIHNLETGKDRVLVASTKVPWSIVGDINICATSPDGRLAFVALNPAVQTVEIAAIDLPTGETKFTFGRHRSYFRELAISADGQWVAGCSTDALRVWRLVGGKRPSRARWHVEDRNVLCMGNLALSRDGTYLATGGYGGHGSISIWDTKAGEELTITSSLGRLYGGGVAFAPDRDLLAYTQHDKNASPVVFWDPVSRTEVKRFDWAIGEIEAITFSPDGCRCAVGGSNQVVIWDVDV
jgi:WD40 repeat protein